MQFNFIDTHNSTCNWLILSPTVTWTNGGIQEQVQILWCAVDMDCNLNFLLIWIWVCWNRRRRRYIGEVVVDRGERKQISMPFKCIQEESVYFAVILYRRTETRQNKFRSCLLLEWTISSYLWAGDYWGFFFGRPIWTTIIVLLLLLPWRMYPFNYMLCGWSTFFLFADWEIPVHLPDQVGR